MGRSDHRENLRQVFCPQGALLPGPIPTAISFFRDGDFRDIEQVELIPNVLFAVLVDELDVPGSDSLSG
jgi:hypothetical protein